MNDAYREWLDVHIKAGESSRDAEFLARELQSAAQELQDEEVLKLLGRDDMVEALAFVLGTLRNRSISQQLRIQLARHRQCDARLYLREAADAIHERLPQCVVAVIIINFLQKVRALLKEHREGDDLVISRMSDEEYIRYQKGA